MDQHFLVEVSISCSESTDAYSLENSYYLQFNLEASFKMASCVGEVVIGSEGGGVKPLECAVCGDITGYNSSSQFSPPSKLLRLHLLLI